MRHWDDEPPDAPGRDDRRARARRSGLRRRAPLARAAGPLRRSRSAATSCVTAPASTSSTRRRSRTSRCSPRRSPGAAGATASSSTGTRSGRGATGSATPGVSSARSAGSCSGSASASSSEAFCISRLTDRRLVEEGFAGTHSVLPGPVRGPGRAVAGTRTSSRSSSTRGGTSARSGFRSSWRRSPHARRQLPELRLELFGDGPDRARAERARARLGLGESVALRRPTAAGGGRAGVRTRSVRRDGVRARGIRPRRRRGGGARDAERRRRRGGERRRRARRRRTSTAPSRRHATPESLGDAIVAVVRGGAALRATTSDWFAEHADELRLERSLEVVLASYAGDEPVDDAPAEHRDALEHALARARRAAGPTARRPGRRTRSSGRRPAARHGARPARTARGGSDPRRARLGAFAPGAARCTGCGCSARPRPRCHLAPGPLRPRRRSGSRS